MSVGDQLGLDDNSELLDQARQKWPAWVAADPARAPVWRDYLLGDLIAEETLGHALTAAITWASPVASRV